MPTLKKGFFGNSWICDVCGEEHIYDFRAEECERQHITDNEGEFGGLIGQLGMNSYSGRVSASKELAQIGKPAVEAILKEMDRSDNHALRSYRDWHSTRYSKEYGANALGEIGDKRALEPLIKLMKYKDDEDGLKKPLWEQGWRDPNIKEAAVRALVKIGDKRAVPSLIKALGDEDQSVRGSAARALGKFDDKRAVQPLIKALGDSDNWEYPVGSGSSLVSALGELGDKRAVQPLIKALDDSDNWGVVRNSGSSLVSALGELGDKRAVQPLIKFLEEGGHGERAAAAANALGKLGDTKAVEPLTEFLEKNYLYESGSAAAKSLEELGWKPENEKQKVVWLITKGDWEPLVELGEAAIGPLIKKCFDSGEARKILARMGKPAIYPLIKEMKKMAKHPFDKKRKERQSIYIRSIFEKMSARDVGEVYEELELYDDADEWYSSHGMLKEAARVRKLKADLAAPKTEIHGDYVDDRDTIVKDSVISKSNVGAGGKSKAEQIKEIKELLDSGAIDEDEFKQMKKEILGK